jgi:hypothetical protein
VPVEPRVEHAKTGLLRAWLHPSPLIPQSRAQEERQNPTLAKMSLPCLPSLHNEHPHTPSLLQDLLISWPSQAHWRAAGLVGHLLPMGTPLAGKTACAVQLVPHVEANTAEGDNVSA